MIFQRPETKVFVPDGLSDEAAFSRITHLGIGAHQDDLEIMAFHGILECLASPDLRFGGVTCTDGRGSPRDGLYRRFTDEGMAAVRRREQEKAAVIGEYGLLVQLPYPSAAVKGNGRTALRKDLAAVLSVCRPRILYTHNLADKHDTHVAVGLVALEAVRSLAPSDRPRAVYGCEVWRGLDWLSDEDKVALDVDGHPGLGAALIGVYDSQVAGGKRYDLATIGRRTANATYFQTHAVDASGQMIFAMDLTPLAEDETLDIADFIDRHIDNFRADVVKRIRRMTTTGKPE
jgi:LmbE family N-acetylglucosaminyl deacetylase